MVNDQAPGAIAMNYVALGPQVQRTTTFAVQCTNGMPYTITTNVTEGVLMNINFPYLLKGDIAGMEVVRQGRRAGNIEVAHAVGPTGRKFLWIGDFTSDNPVGEGTDLWAVRTGAIAITPLHLDLTHGAMAGRLAEAFP